MKNKSKLITALLTAGALILSASSAFAAPTPVENVPGLTLLEGYESLEKGANLIPDKIWEFSATSGTATADDAFKGDGLMAAKLTASTEQNNCSIKVPFEMGSLEGETGFILYVKMPVNSTSQNKDITLLVAPESNVEGSAGGYKLKDVSIKSLPKGAKAWQDVTTGGGTMWLPNGYEGYLKFNLSDFMKNYGAVPDDINDCLDKLNFLSIYVGAVGGKQEGEVDNAFYIDSIMSFDSTYDGSLGFVPADPNAPFEPTEVAEGLYSFESFDQYQKGEDLVYTEAKPGPVFDAGGAGGVATADDAYAGLGGFSAKVDNELMATGWVALKLGLPDQTDFTPYDGFIIYLKGPKDCSREDKWGTFGLGLNFDSNKEGFAGGYKIKSKEKVGVLCAGSTEWKETECTDGNIYLPYDFEGYLKVDYSSLIYNYGAISQDFSEAVEHLNFFTVWISGLGQEYGSIYFDDFMFYTEDFANGTDFVPEGWADREAPQLEDPDDGKGDDDGNDDDDDIQDIVIPGLDDDNNQSGEIENTDKPEKTGVASGLSGLLIAAGAGCALVVTKKRRKMK